MKRGIFSDNLHATYNQPEFLHKSAKRKTTHRVTLSQSINLQSQFQNHSTHKPIQTHSFIHKLPFSQHNKNPVSPTHTESQIHSPITYPSSNHYTISHKPNRPIHTRTLQHTHTHTRTHIRWYTHTRHFDTYAVKTGPEKEEIWTWKKKKSVQISSNKYEQ